MISTVPEIRLTDRLTISEAARRMGIDRGTLYNYHRRGLLNVYHRRLNNRPYVLGRDLLKLWNSSY